MSYSGAPPPYAAPSGLMPTPRRPGRKGPPVWLGILVLLGGPAIYLVAVFVVVAPTLSGAADAIQPMSSGKPFAVRGDSDYIVVSTEPASCTAKVPGKAKEPLRHGVRENHPVRYQGQIFYPVGYFDAGKDGRARVACTPRTALLATMRWQGDVGQVVNVGRYGGYAAGAAVLLGILMIVFRRKKPVW